MKKKENYLGKYLKSNALVLVCELAVVLLLGFICAFIANAEPLWLAPVLAFVAYLLAELRFMMAYVATNVRRDRDNAPANELDPDAPMYDEMLNGEFGAQPAPFMPPMQPQFDQQQFDQPQFDQPQFDQAQFDQPQFDQPQFDQPQFDQPAAEEAAPAVEDAAQPAFVAVVSPQAQEISIPVQEDVAMDDEDGAVDALFAEYMSKQQAAPRQTAESIVVPVADIPQMDEATVPVEEPMLGFESPVEPAMAPQLELEAEPEQMETIELPDEDFTMDDGAERGNAAPTVARDTLDIGEIGNL